MDAIFAVHRPNYHLDFQDPLVHFYSHKIRKQNLVGRTGQVEDITFNVKENRYYFSGQNPLAPDKPSYEKNDIFKNVENNFENPPF